MEQPEFAESLFPLPSIGATHMMTIGQLRKILDQIGKIHDKKTVAILMNTKAKIGEVITLDATDIGLQFERILIGSDK